MMIYGPAGVGKTWFTHTLMLMAATGRGAGIKNTQDDGWVLRAGGHEGAKVYLVDGEMVRVDIAERTKVLCGALELEEEGDAPSVLESIKVAAKATQDHRAEFVDLAEREWLHRIIEFCKGQKIEAIIFDNLATLTPTLEDENAATSWSSLNDMVVALKREGIAVVLVHHSGKAGGYRGSSNIVTTLETVVALQRVEGPSTDGDARFKVVLEKSRAHGRAAIDGRVLRLQEGKWAVKVDEFGLAPQVVEAILSLRYENQAEVGKALGVDQSTVSRAITKADMLGLARKTELAAALGKARQLKLYDKSGVFEELAVLDI